jgi:hypothetical protein
MALTLSQLINLQCLFEKLKLGLVHLDVFSALTLIITVRRSQSSAAP